VAAGALTQLTAQVLGLAVLLVIFTVLARRLALVELGAYGLMAHWLAYWKLWLAPGERRLVRSVLTSLAPRAQGPSGP